MTDEDDAVVGERTVPGQAGRAIRPSGGDDLPTSGTTGDAGGTSGWAVLIRDRLRQADRRDLTIGWLIILGVAVVLTTINALTALADAPQVEAWKPWLWEGTSMGVLLLLLWIPWLAIVLAPPDELAAKGWRSKAGFLATHGSGLLIYSALHVGGFIVMRKIGYRLIEGESYAFGDRFIYELRKDLVSYALFVFIFWMVGYFRRRREQPVRPVSFDIRDGARIIRTPLADILAVSSAGNYVEFWLADGRRPLMRATLVAIEVEIGEFGFVRTHRSWLVNAGSVSGLRPDGSGDWTVELGAIEAPVSRRYPHALARLRG